LTSKSPGRCLATTTRVYLFFRRAKAECKPTTPALSCRVIDLDGGQSPDPSTTTNFGGAADDSIKLAARYGFNNKKEMIPEAKRRANLKMVLMVSLVPRSQSFSERHVYSHKLISMS
jgi:hypothetical protein